MARSSGWSFATPNESSRFPFISQTHGLRVSVDRGIGNETSGTPKQGHAMERVGGGGLAGVNRSTAYRGECVCVHVCDARRLRAGCSNDIETGRDNTDHDAHAQLQQQG